MKLFRLLNLLGIFGFAANLHQNEIDKILKNKKENCSFSHTYRVGYIEVE